MSYQSYSLNPDSAFQARSASFLFALIPKTKSGLKVVLLSILLSVGYARAKAQVAVSRQQMLMGSVFEFTIVAADHSEALIHIDIAIREIERIENLISEWRPHTQISEVNQNAGIRPVKVDREVFNLTKRALAYSDLSKGAFDISIAAMDKVWLFDGSMDKMPPAPEIENSIRNVGYENIILDSIQQTIFLRKKGMKIGFGSIGKGYAADQSRELLKSFGIRAGIVNASGDIVTWGVQPNGKPWKIGVKNPFKRFKLAKTILFQEGAVATSGSYEKYAELDGKRYGHILDPRTGMPSSGLTSVTVYGPSAEFANALSTSVMVLGLENGLEFLIRHPDYQFILITDQGKIIRKRK